MKQYKINENGTFTWRFEYVSTKGRTALKLISLFIFIVLTSQLGKGREKVALCRVFVANYLTKVTYLSNASSFSMTCCETKNLVKNEDLRTKRVCDPYRAMAAV